MVPPDGADFGLGIAGSGLLALFVIMLLKEVGVPIPVPSDLLMITAGVQAATGSFSLAHLTLVLLVAIFIGGTVQFFLVRKVGRAALYRSGRRFGLSPERVEHAMARLRARGPLAVFLGLNTPGARAGIIVAAGLAELPYPRFAPAMVAGSAVFYGWHIALGYLVGPSATTLLTGIHVPPGLVLAGLAALGLGGWLVLRGRRTASTAASSGSDESSDAGDAARNWTEAACPACLAFSALSRRSEP